MAKRKSVRRKHYRGLDSATAIAKGLRHDAKDARILMGKGDCRHAFLALMNASGAAGALSQETGARRGKPGAGKVVFKLEDRFMRTCLLRGRS